LGTSSNGVFIIIAATLTIRLAMTRNIKQHQKWALRFFLYMAGFGFSGLASFFRLCSMEVHLVLIMKLSLDFFCLWSIFNSFNISGMVFLCSRKVLKNRESGYGDKPNYI